MHPASQRHVELQLEELIIVVVHVNICNFGSHETNGRRPPDLRGQNISCLGTGQDFEVFIIRR